MGTDEARPDKAAVDRALKLQAGSILAREVEWLREHRTQLAASLMWLGGELSSAKEENMRLRVLLAEAEDAADLAAARAALGSGEPRVPHATILRDIER